MRYFGIFLMFILVALGFLFTLQNATQVSILLGSQHFQVPLSLALYLTLLLGIVLGWSIGFWSRLRLLWKVKRLQSKR